VQNYVMGSGPLWFLLSRSSWYQTQIPKYASKSLESDFAWKAHTDLPLEPENCQEIVS